MHITIYQILVAATACFVIAERAVRFFRHGQGQSIVKFLTVILVWGMIGAVALYPEIAHFIRRTFGFGENFNTMIFIAFVILFVLFFRILGIIEKIESDITDIVRRESLVEGRRKRRRKAK